MSTSENQAQKPARAQYLERAAAAAKAQARNDWQAVLNEWNRALEFVQDIPGAWRGKAIALERLERFDQARNAFAEGLKQWPEDTALLFGTARIDEKRGDWNAALASWKMAKSRAPERSEAFLGIGRSLTVLRREDEARTLLEEAAALWPDDERLMMLLGQVLRQTGEPDEVVAYWRDLAQKRPERGDIAFLLADVLHQSGQDEEAIIEALRAAKECSAPNAPHLLEQAAELALRLAENLHPPEEYLKTAIELAVRFPKNAQVQAAMARRHFFDGDMNTVIRGLTGRITETPDDWTAYVGLGEALQQMSASEPEGTKKLEIRLAAELDRSGSDIGPRFAAFLRDTATPLRPSLLPGPGEILESAGGESDTVVIMFGGMEKRQRTALPFLMERFFASRGIKPFYIADQKGNFGAARDILSCRVNGPDSSLSAAADRAATQQANLHDRQFRRRIAGSPLWPSPGG